LPHLVHETPDRLLLGIRIQRILSGLTTNLALRHQWGVFYLGPATDTAHFAKIHRYRHGKGECGEHEVETRRFEGAELAIFCQTILPVRVGILSQLDHPARYVDANCIKTELLQESRRAAGAASEIEGRASGGVLGDAHGQIAVCQIIRGGELEFCIFFGSFRIVVYIEK